MLKSGQKPTEVSCIPSVENMWVCYLLCEWHVAPQKKTISVLCSSLALPRVSFN